jgi:hypothetical protein
MILEEAGIVPVSYLDQYQEEVQQSALDDVLPILEIDEQHNVESDTIITAAGNKRGGFPSQGVFNVDELLDALPAEASKKMNNYNLPIGVRKENQLTHDMKIESAGELYVGIYIIEFE